MNAIACLECNKLSPSTCANHKPVRPPRWSPTAPTLPPVPKSRGAAVYGRDKAIEHRDALAKVAGFPPDALVSLDAEIAFYSSFCPGGRREIEADDGDHDASADVAS